MGVYDNGRAMGVAHFNEFFLLSLATGIQKVLKDSWNLQIHLKISPLI